MKINRLPHVYCFLLPLLIAFIALLQPTSGTAKIGRGRLPYKTLTWSDFVVDDKAPGVSEDTDAQTRTFLSLAYDKHVAATTGANTAFTAQVSRAQWSGGFDGDASWRRSSVLQGDAALLRHEQGHLDMNEARSKELHRLPLSAYPTGVGATATDALRDLDGKIAAFYRTQARDLQNEQQRYDAETKSGTKAAPQAAWSTRLTAAVSAPTN